MLKQSSLDELSLSMNLGEGTPNDTMCRAILEVPENKVRFKSSLILYTSCSFQILPT